MSTKNVNKNAEKTQSMYTKVYTDRSVLLTRENVSVGVYIVLYMLKKERSLRYVTLRVSNWHVLSF